MAIRIDRHAFWLLNAVLEVRENLAVLLSPRIEEALNRQTPGLGFDELVTTLSSLCEGNLIEVKNQAGLQARSAHEIEGAFDVSRYAPGHSEGFWYGLTPAGGSAWEAVTRPDWSVYLESYTSHDEIRIEAASRERAMAELVRAATDPAHVPVPGTMEESALTPWQPVYWKTLPKGYFIRYAYTQGTSNVRWLLSQPPPQPWYSVPDL